MARLLINDVMPSFYEGIPHQRCLLRMAGTVPRRGSSP
jgi:hypothetical protein